MRVVDGGGDDGGRRGVSQVVKVEGIKRVGGREVGEIRKTFIAEREAE